MGLYSDRHNNRRGDALRPEVCMGAGQPFNDLQKQLYTPEERLRRDSTPWTLVVIGLLWKWGLTLYSVGVGMVVVMQLIAMKRLLRNPKQYAPWYNATGISLYVLGMMGTAIGLGGWL